MRFFHHHTVKTLPPSISGNLQRFQNRQALLGKLGCLAVEFGQVFFGRVDRLTFLGQALIQGLKVLPDELRPLLRLLLALVACQQKELLETVNRQCATSYRAGQVSDIITAAALPQRGAD